MSSDLWAAFAGQSRDLSDNPWAQSSEDILDEPDKSNGSKEPHALAPKSFYHNSQTAVKEPGHHQDLEQRYKSLTTADPWPHAHSQQQSIWGGVEPNGFTPSPWDVLSASAHENFTFAQTNVQASYHPRQEEDDFGDFEEPEAPHPKGNLQARPSSPPVKLPDHRDDVVAMIHTEPLDNSTSIGLEHDPWADVEFLAKPKLSVFVAQAANSSSPDLPVEQERPPQVETPQYLEQTVDMSYDTDEWDEFSPDPKDAPQSIPTKSPLQRETESTSNGDVVASHSRFRSETPTTAVSAPTPSNPTSTKSTSAAPPTNVPPPSILISLIASLVQKLPAQVSKVIAQTPQAKTTPKALSQALRRCLASLRVAARILSGRKLRWKRDAYLSQSMRIGPATAGKAGGMKLTGVDRAETQREDREAAEFVRIWRQNLGSIRAALASVNGLVDGQPLTLPEISEYMVVRTAKAADGGIPAPRSCFLCGVKRDERVGSIDGEVLDSFGEWWVEHWGHVECRTFWEDHEQFLQRRG